MAPKLIELQADNIASAAEQIIHLLEDTDKGGDVIYFHGWRGWGASAVLKEVVKQLRSSLGSDDSGTAGGLEKIIHVDFSRWQCKRALQKAIAEELELPEQVMALFDQRDEEDDFDGVEQSARGVIPHVRVAIMNELNPCSFLVVLHNWSGSYMELREVGVPLIGELGKRVLWTSKGRLWPHVTARHDEDEYVDEIADIAICVDLLSSGDEEDASSGDEDDAFKNILYAEIDEVAKYTGVPEPDMSLKIVTECILYMAARANDQGITWESHGSNYWVCDGIIQDAADGGRSAWEISAALQRNMNLDFCNKCAEDICQILSGDKWWRTDQWISMTSQNSMEVEMTSLATSFFCTTDGPSSSSSHNGTMILDAGIFEHSGGTSSLRVIHLSHSTFSFSSPPFLSCSNLRFLLLDHCKDQDTQDLGGKRECHHHSQCSQQGGGACFRNLWVLELSYTNWYWLLSKDMLDLMADLRELNVKGVGNWSMMHLQQCSGARRKNRRVVKLRVVVDPSNDHGNGDRNEEVSSPVVALSFPDLSSWHNLKTVVLDGCGDLELIDHNALPQQSLESFTLINNNIVSSNKIKRISFRGCSKLNCLLLRGFFGSLVELDMSGTSIKTLDLSATQAMGLRRLFLLGCLEFRAILWPKDENNNVRLQVLHIDTTTTHAAWYREEGKSNKQQEATTAISDNASIEGSTLATMCGKDPTTINSDWYISIRDPRFFRSLMNLRRARGLQVEISSTDGHKDTSSERIYSNACDQQMAAGNLYYVDDIISTTFNSNSQADDSNRLDVEASTMKRTWLWHCPPIPNNHWPHCYISIRNETRTESLPGTTPTSTPLTAPSLPDFVHVDAQTLHIHDSLSITCLPRPAPATTDAVDLTWNSLLWCRLERCPNLEGVVFTTPQQGKRVIFLCMWTFWASQLPMARYIWNWSTLFRPGYSSFWYLVFLHVDYCPRLVHVLPLFTSNPHGCRSLETIEIVCCGDLKEVFPSDSESQQRRQTREFSSLKRIHLYELPKLQRICGHYRMLAPNLETVKVRGCWDLRRLPAVEHCISTPPVMVECEKDWWDGLEWEGESAGHHPSHYKPSFSSAYYKKQHLRTSVLR